MNYELYFIDYDFVAFDVTIAINRVNTHMFLLIFACDRRVVRMFNDSSMKIESVSAISVNQWIFSFIIIIIMIIIIIFFVQSVGYAVDL
jgi:hypothetical protein